MPVYRFNLPSAYDSVGQARRAILRFAQPWFAPGELGDIESAVGEALANCAEHGHRNGTSIEVACIFDGVTLTIEIKDAGEGFERWNASDYLQPLSDASRGFGTYIMRELMDEMEYSEHGTRLRLAKRVRAGSGDLRSERAGLRSSP